METEPTKRVLKWGPVFLDDRDHVIGGGRVALVGLQPPAGGFFVWTEETRADTHIERRKARVFGTGHPIPPEYVDHLGSVIDPPFVWHVYAKAVGA